MPIPAELEALIEKRKAKTIQPQKSSAAASQRSPSKNNKPFVVSGPHNA